MFANMPAKANKNGQLDPNYTELSLVEFLSVAKQRYFLKLLPPRPTFARDMTHEEPSVRAGLNRFELYPMQVSAARAKAPHPAIEGVPGNAAGEMGW